MTTDEVDLTAEDYRQMLYQTPVGLIQFRNNGFIETINPAACNLLMTVVGGSKLENLFEALHLRFPTLSEKIAAFEDECGPIIDQHPLNFDRLAKHDHFRSPFPGSSQTITWRY